MPTFRRFLKDESGQAILEFVLLLLVTIGVITFLKNNIKSITVKFWSYLAKRIAAPCPNCDAGDDFVL
jgi:Flp pilus assembly pilin Flp